MTRKKELSRVLSNLTDTLGLLNDAVKSKQVSRHHKRQLKGASKRVEGVAVSIAGMITSVCPECEGNGCKACDGSGVR